MPGSHQIIPNVNNDHHSSGAINSARDFSPRLFASFVYGKVAFTGIAGTNSEYFFWIPFFGPFVGGVVGAGAYTLFVMAPNEDTYVVNPLSVQQ